VITRPDQLARKLPLAEITRASRPTVRDALLALDLFGVIEVRPKSGAYVTTNSLRREGLPSLFDSPPRELIETREYIEPAVAGLCAGRLPADELDRLSTLIDDCEREGQRAAADDYEEFLRLSHQFHYILAMNCGNSMLADFTSRLVDVSAHPLWMIVNGLHVRDQSMRASQVAEHRQVLAAIAAGDAESAAEAMYQHLTGLESGIFGRPQSRKSKTIRPRRR
jgi:GntR family transcriptional repressor for pyruvate dehydrogenase complex